MIKQAINIARHMMVRSLQAHDQRLALKVINTTRRRNTRAQQNTQQRAAEKKNNSKPKE